MKKDIRFDLQCCDRKRTIMGVGRVKDDMGFGDSNSSLHSTVTVNSPISATSGKRLRQHILVRRRVTFSDTVQVVETIHVNDFSDEEYSLYWISHDEQDVILNMADVTAELMSIGACEDDEHICFRGLEGKTPEANQEYSDKYINLIDAILYEQEQDRISGREMIDHERIAQLYGGWTQPCKEIAWHRALLDEHIARLDNDNNCFNMLIRR
jgi:hypothetical protein